MKNKVSITVIFFVIILIISGITIGQESTYLAQKLMLENDLHRRISNALGKILEDHRYVLDVTVDLTFTPTVREEITYKPAKEVTEPIEEGALQLTTVTETQQKRRYRSTGIPIPGFDFQIEEEPVPEETVEIETEELPPVQAKAKAGPQIMSQSYMDITSSMPVIERLEISCILPEGSSPELIENVRQIIKVASHYNRNRGDILSIMTATFKERRDERTAEAIILRSIAEKIDKLEQQQEEVVAEEKGLNWREELLQWREEEARQREEERTLWRAELEKLETERIRRDFEEKRQATLERDSVKWGALTTRINQLESILDSAQLSAEERQTAVEERMSRERERAQLDSLIEERLAVFRDYEEKAVEELASLEGERNNLPIYLMSAISLLAVVALAAVILFNSRKPKYVVPPPWMMRRPPPKRVKKKRPGEVKVPRKTPDEGAPTATLPPQDKVTAATPSKPSEDPGVLKSEIKSARQSVISMSVAQPETATTIVKEWLEEEAPPPPEAESQTPTTEVSGEEEEEGKKKKKKKGEK